MHRRPLLDLLDRYVVRFPEDRERAAVFRRFVEAHPDCFERSCLEGHVTGSAWIVSPDGEQALLVRHRKLVAWLQPGGHADGELDPSAVAQREAAEETGLARLSLVDWWRDGSGDAQPFDLDVHVIPSRGPAEPEHLHLDVRYLLVGDPEEPIRPSVESDEVKWVARADIEALTREESVLRMARRAVELRARARSQ